MKRALVIGSAGFVLLVCGTVFGAPDHPHLRSAHADLIQARADLLAAQQAHDFDLHGDAAAGQKAITAAIHEVNAALGVAGDN